LIAWLLSLEKEHKEQRIERFEYRFQKHDLKVFPSQNGNSKALAQGICYLLVFNVFLKFAWVNK